MLGSWLQSTLRPSMVLLKIRWNQDVKCVHGSTLGPMCFLCLMVIILNVTISVASAGCLTTLNTLGPCKGAWGMPPYLLSSFFLRTTESGGAVDWDSLRGSPISIRQSPEALILFRNWQLLLKRSPPQSCHALLQSRLVECPQTKFRGFFFLSFSLWGQDFYLHYFWSFLIDIVR